MVVACVVLNCHQDKSAVHSGGLTPNEIGIIVGVIGGTALLAIVIGKNSVQLYV